MSRPDFRLSPLSVVSYFDVRCSMFDVECSEFSISFILHPSSFILSRPDNRLSPFSVVTNLLSSWISSAESEDRALRGRNSIAVFGAAAHAIEPDPGLAWGPTVCVGALMR